MTGRTVAAALSSLGLALFVAACTGMYEIPIETPIQPKMDVSPFQRVLVAGFIAGGSDDVDANLETVRLLRSQLRTKSPLRVIDADVLPLIQVAREQNTPEPQSATDGTAPETNGGTNGGSPGGGATDGEQAAPAGAPQTGGGAADPATAPPPQGQSGAAGTDGKNGKAAPPPQNRGGQAAQGPGPIDPQAPRIRDEKDLEPLEGVFANVAYWKKIGEEYQNPLIVTGTVLFTPHARSGFVQREQEYYDNFGRRRVVPVRTYMERKGFILRPKFIFIDGRTGTTLYSEAFREEILYSPQQNTPALSSYFELMDRLIPSFLSTLSTQKIKGSRVLLK
jgi:hypothetical protein